MRQPIVIWGAGAIGGTIGAYLARAGHQVLMVDVDKDHVARMQAEGLRIEGPVDDFSVRVRAATPETLIDRFDLILLAVKSQHTATATKALMSNLAQDGCVVSVQNGLNEGVIAQTVGMTRTMGCFVNFGADYVAPGRIHYGGRGAFVLGEIDGTLSNRLYDLQNLLGTFEPDIQVTDNIFGYLWSKLAFTAVLIAQTISDEPTEAFLDNPKWRPLIYQMVREVAMTARADDVSLMPFQAFDPNDFLEADVRRMRAAIDGYAEARRGSKKLYSGIWRDLVVRKRSTEVSAVTDPVIAAARRLGIDVATYARSLQMIRAVEAGEERLGQPLSETLLRLAQTRCDWLEGN